MTQPADKDNGSAPLVTFEELDRLRQIEHLAWHMMEDSEENASTGEITINPLRDDYDKLGSLLPETHPPEWLPAPAVRPELGRNEETPLVDAIALRHGEAVSLSDQQCADQWNDLLYLARQLERELAALQAERKSCYGLHSSVSARSLLSTDPSPAERLRDFLADPECHVADDIPDEIWLPFCESLRTPISTSVALDVPEGCTVADAQLLRKANGDLAQENHNLRRCLRWYANGGHIVGFDEWEGPSGDENWLCPPPKDTGLPSIDEGYVKFIETLDQHMIEDGAVARTTLCTGKFEVESPEDEPKVVKGEPEWHVEQTAKALSAIGECKP